MDTAEITWLVLMIFCLVVEGGTAAVTTIWFAIGALAALIAALLGANIWVQIGIFGIVSGLCMLALRPLLKKYINPKKTRTNVDALIGKEGVVLETIDNLSGTGKVKLGGMEWSARSVSGEKIEAGAVIRVEKIEGVKVFVTMHNSYVGTADGLK